MSAVLDFALPPAVRAETPDDATSRLRYLAERIGIEHALVTKHLRAAVNHARRTGMLLIEAKKAVPYGSWGRWLDQTGVRDRTGQLYMAIASRWADIETYAGDPQRVADLTVKACDRILRSLSERRPKNTPPAADPRQPRLFDDCRPTTRIDEPLTRTVTLHVPLEESDAFGAMVSRLGVASGTNTVTATIVAAVRRAYEELLSRRPAE